MKDIKSGLLKAIIKQAEPIGERKRLMVEKSDAIAMLVGGTGTLDEVMETTELKKHNLHNKPIVLLNTANFYEGLKMQFLRMQDEGFLTKPLEELLYFADTPQDAIIYINKYLQI